MISVNNGDGKAGQPQRFRLLWFTCW